MSSQHSEHHQRSRAAHRRRNRWTQNSLVWIIGAVVVLLGVIILFSSGSAKTGNRKLPANQPAADFSNRPIPDFTPAAGEGPRIEVSQDTLDYGDVEYNVPVNAVFYVRNVGDEPLILEDTPQIEVVKGCCPPQVQVSSQTLPPGTESTISMTFSMHEGMDGFHEFRLYVRTNDPVEPVKELKVLSNWIPPA